MYTFESKVNKHGKFTYNRIDIGYIKYIFVFNKTQARTYINIKVNGLLLALLNPPAITKYCLTSARQYSVQTDW